MPKATPSPTPNLDQVPMEPAVSSGQHSFTFCVRRDSNDGSGVGLIADGRESCLKGLGFPNNGQHGIWWLRRFCSQVYSAERIGAIGLGLDPNPNLRV